MTSSLEKSSQHEDIFRSRIVQAMSYLISNTWLWQVKTITEQRLISTYILRDLCNTHPRLELHTREEDQRRRSKLILRGRGRLRIPSISRSTNSYAEVGTSKNVNWVMAVIGFTTCATTSTATSHTNASLTQTESRGLSDSHLDIDSHTKEWLSRDLTTEDFGVRKYKRGFEWDWTNAIGYSNAIDSSLLAAPLDSPPSLDDDPCAKYALSQYKDMFLIECPVDVKMFEFLLKDHPNQVFVQSVVEGLKRGFWPMSEIPSNKTVVVPNHKVCEERPDLLESARDEEVEAGRYSEGFYTLLPGIKVSPLLLVLKKGSTKMRVCTDMSFGKPSLNDSIIKDKIRVCFDSLISFAPYMVDLARRGIKMILWKSV